MYSILHAARTAFLKYYFFGLFIRQICIFFAQEASKLNKNGLTPVHVAWGKEEDD